MPQQINIVNPAFTMSESVGVLTTPLTSSNNMHHLHHGQLAQVYFNNSMNTNSNSNSALGHLNHNHHPLPLAGNMALKGSLLHQHVSPINSTTILQQANSAKLNSQVNLNVANGSDFSHSNNSINIGNAVVQTSPSNNMIANTTASAAFHSTSGRNKSNTYFD